MHIFSSGRQHVAHPYRYTSRYMRNDAVLCKHTIYMRAQEHGLCRKPEGGHGALARENASGPGHDLKIPPTHARDE